MLPVNIFIGHFLKNSPVMCGFIGDSCLTIIGKTVAGEPGAYCKGQ